MNTLTRSTLGQTVSSRALPLWLLSMVGHLLQNSTMYICMQQSILIQLQHRIFSFNDYIDSTSTLDIFIQRLYSFNFNKGYFCARQIFIQLQRPKLCFMKRIYNYIQLQQKNIFIQQNIFIQLFKFLDIDKFLFNKAPPPYPPAAPCVKTWKQHI